MISELVFFLNFAHLCTASFSDRSLAHCNRILWRLVSTTHERKTRWRICDISKERVVSWLIWPKITWNKLTPSALTAGRQGGAFFSKTCCFRLINSNIWVLFFFFYTRSRKSFVADRTFGLFRSVKEWQWLNWNASVASLMRFAGRSSSLTFLLELFFLKLQPRFLVFLFELTRTGIWNDLQDAVI